MSTVLKHSKMADDKSRYTVFGYVRKMGNHLSSSAVATSIPHLCLGYFYGEYFAKSAKQTKITNNGNTVTKIERTFDWKNTTYGNVWIDSLSKQIATWTLKMTTKDGESPDVFVCIVSNDCHENEDCSAKDPPNYAFNLRALDYIARFDTLQSLEAPVNQDITNQHHDQYMKSDEEFKVILNLQNGTIGCKKDNQDEMVIFEKIDQKEQVRYKLAVSFCDDQDCATIVDFNLQ